MHMIWLSMMHTYLTYLFFVGHDHMKEQVKPLFCDIWHGPFSRCCSWASCYTIWCILVLWLSYGLHLNFPEVPTLWLKCGQRYAILMRVAQNVISYLCHMGHMGHIIDSERHILKAISFKFEMVVRYWLRKSFLSLRFLKCCQNVIYSQLKCQNSTSLHQYST